MAFPLLRSRLAALLLLVASPGILGVAADGAHPCPEKAPWTVEDQTSHHHDQAPAEPHQCRCVGECTNASPPAPPLANDLLRVVTPALVAPVRPAALQVLFADRPQDRLPPATAPPVV